MDVHVRSIIIYILTFLVIFLKLIHKTWQVSFTAKSQGDVTLSHHKAGRQPKFLSLKTAHIVNLFHYNPPPKIFYSNIFLI